MSTTVHLPYHTLPKCLPIPWFVDINDEKYYQHFCDVTAAAVFSNIDKNFIRLMQFMFGTYPLAISYTKNQKNKNPFGKYKWTATS